jgi:hypothetical protein
MHSTSLTDVIFLFCLTASHYLGNPRSSPLHEPIYIYIYIYEEKFLINSFVRNFIKLTCKSDMYFLIM